MKEKNKYGKIKKTLFMGFAATMLAGNAAGMDFRVNTIPNSEPIRVEQFLPQSEQNLQSEYDTADALKLFADMENSSLLNMLNSLKCMNDEEILALMPEIKAEFIDYIRRSKVNNQKLKAAYTKFYKNGKIPEAISGILNQEFTAELKQSGKSKYINAHYDFDDNGFAYVKSILNLNLQDKPDMHMLVNTNEMDEELKKRNNITGSKLGKLVSSCYSRAMKNQEEIVDYTEQLKLIKECVDGLSPKYFGDEKMRAGFLIEICNGILLSENLWNCGKRRNIDIRQIIEEAAKPYEQTQEMESRMGM